MKVESIHILHNLRLNTRLIQEISSDHAITCATSKGLIGVVKELLCVKGVDEGLGVRHCISSFFRLNDVVVGCRLRGRPHPEVRQSDSKRTLQQSKEQSGFRFPCHVAASCCTLSYFLFLVSGLA